MRQREKNEQSVEDIVYHPGNSKDLLTMNVSFESLICFIRKTKWTESDVLTVGVSINKETRDDYLRPIKDC